MSIAYTPHLMGESSKQITLGWWVLMLQLFLILKHKKKISETKDTEAISEGKEIGNKL
ncbi:hypothetical protein YC2023_079779 [Brassica napus]